MVVDACQLRSEEENIRKYVSLGFLTLVTGSKFYCGPPFCGAVLFPPAALAELEAGHEHLPAGFEDYFTRHEVRTKSWLSLCCVSLKYFSEIVGFSTQQAQRKLLKPDNNVVSCVYLAC